MTRDIRFLGTLLNIILFALCFLRLHRVTIKSASFMLWLCLTMAFGWLLIGDASHWLPWIDLGDMGEVGPGIRFIMFRIILLVGIIYISIFGPCRKYD